MNESDAIAGMVMPSQLRPNAYLGGIIQIHVTRACDRACVNCTQGSQLRGKSWFMSPEQFEVAANSLKDYFGVVGVFGGNPCLSPHFEAYCEILRRTIPKNRCGLWSNKLFGHGAIARETFNPRHSNLNVHLDQAAYDEFRRDWPESRPVGLKGDSRHSPPFVAMLDVVPDESERWGLIANCDINRNWSALIGVFRGELRGYFCEIAGAQAMLHQDDSNWPDIGVPVDANWWRRDRQDFANQIRFHCHRCGVPLRGRGDLAATGNTEQVSLTHLDIYRPKKSDRKVEVVESVEQLRGEVGHVTDYLQNAK